MSRLFPFQASEQLHSDLLAYASSSVLGLETRGGVGSAGFAAGLSADS